MIHTFGFELKQLDESGTFTGLASTYGGAPDLQNDVIIPGAFTRSLQAGANKPLLMGHRDPVGTVMLKDSTEGLLASGRLSLGIQAGRDAHTLLKDGVIRGLSIGFQSVRDEVKDGVRHLLELKIFEVSLTAIPANPEALITSVKSMDEVRNALASFRADVSRAISGVR